MLFSSEQIAITQKTLLAFAPVAREAALRGQGGIIHFEIQPKNINKVVEATVPVLGDLISNLAALVPLVETSNPRKEWFSQIASWKKKYPFTYVKSKEGQPTKPQEVIEELDRQTRSMKDNVVVSTGVGQHQMWATQFYRWTAPRSLVSSGGLGVSLEFPAIACFYLIAKNIDYGLWLALSNWCQGCSTRENCG